MNETGVGPWSAIWTFTTEFTPPEMPDSFTLNKQNNAPLLLWETSGLPSGFLFNIYRGPTPRELELLTTVESGVSSFVDNEIPEGIYFYSLSMISPGGEESEKTDALSFVNIILEAEQEWKLTSVPVNDLEVMAELATLYRFSEKYFRENSMLPLSGYWLKTRSFEIENYPVKGSGLMSASFTLNEGWNLIGSLADSIHIDDIDDPANILSDVPVFVYEQNNYTATNYLVPNHGHWIFANEAGQIHAAVQKNPVDAGTATKLATSINKSMEHSVDHQASKQEDYNLQLLIEHDTASASLFISNAPGHYSDLTPYFMPPLSPDPVLDVRVENNTNLYQASHEKVYVRSSDYPLKLTLKNRTDRSALYRLTTFKDHKSMHSADLLPEKQFLLESQFDYFTLEEIDESQRIQHDKLAATYPNPFNPTTTIEFEVAQLSQVKLEVFDMAGRRVSVLADEIRQPGRHSVIFQANTLSSGVYFVRFSTPQMVDVQKITLLK